MGPPLSHNYLRLGAGSLKTLSLKLNQPFKPKKKKRGGGKLKTFSPSPRKKKSIRWLRLILLKQKTSSHLPKRILPGYVNEQTKNGQTWANTGDLHYFMKLGNE